MSTSRHRTDGNISRDLGYRRQTAVSGSTSVASSYKTGNVGTFKTMDDVVVENFRRRVANGEVFNNPMHQYSFSGASTLSGYAHQRAPIRGESSSNIIKDEFDSLLHWKLGPLPLLEESWPPRWGLISLSDKREADAEASARAIRDYSSNIANGYVILGELTETLQLLRNPLAGMTKLLTELYRARIRPGALVRELSSQYLKVIFGILPLMVEAENVLKAVSKAYSSKRTTYRGSRNLSQTQVRQGVLLHQGSALTDSRYSEVVQCWYSVRAGILAEAELNGLRKTLGLQFSNIPKAAWELLPLSFILDWALNLKRYIEMLTFQLTSGAKAEWIVYEDITQVTRVVTSTTVSSPWVVTRGCTDMDTMTYTAKSRIPVNLGTNRTITPVTPKGIGKYVSALAIAAQRFF